MSPSLFYFIMDARILCCRSVCNLFDIGKATGIRTIERIAKALVALAAEVIQWPAGARLATVVDHNRRKAGFPGAIGAVDGCHIRINAPREHPNSYYNRKKFHSMVLQVPQKMAKWKHPREKY